MRCIFHSAQSKSPWRNIEQNREGRQPSNSSNSSKHGYMPHRSRLRECPSCSATQEDPMREKQRSHPASSSLARAQRQRAPLPLLSLNLGLRKPILHMVGMRAYTALPTQHVPKLHAHHLRLHYSTIPISSCIPTVSMIVQPWLRPIQLRTENHHHHHR